MRENETLDKNLAALLGRSYKPVQPSEIFQRRLLVQMQQRQNRGLGPRVHFSQLAAAAVILFSIVVAWQLAVSHITASGQGEIQLASSAGHWQQWSGAVPVSEGDRVRAEQAPVEVAWSSSSRVTLEPGAELRVADGEPYLEAGRCRLETESERRSLATSLLVTHARDADLGIEIHEIPYTRKESEAMSPKKIGVAVGVSTAILITVIVYQSADDEPVVVEPKNGADAVELAQGERGTFGPDGSVVIDGGTTAASNGGDDEPKVEADFGDATPAGSGRAIAGRVQDVAGNPIAGAQVTFLSEVRAPDTDVDETMSLASAVAKEDGSFTLRVSNPNVTSGEIRASFERFVATSHPWTAPDPESEETAPSDDESTETEGVETSDADLVVLTLSHETAISGRVLLPGVEETRPIMVAIEYYVNMWERDEPIMKTFEDEAGDFYFGGIKPGNYRVWAYSRGFYRSNEIKVAPAEGQHVSGIDFSLSPGTGLTGQVFSKRTGAPVAGAIVFAPQEHLPGTVNEFQRDHVDENVGNADKTVEGGRFSLEDLPPGRHLFRVVHPDYMTWDGKVEIAEGETPNLEVELEEGFGIRGKVLDRDGAPPPNGAVLAFTMNMQDPTASQRNFTEVEEDGAYFLAHLNPGPYIVVMVPDMESGARESVKVTMASHSGNADTTVDFIEIPELATLRGRILDEDGEILSGVNVTATYFNPENGDMKFKSGMSNEEGVFEILNLDLVEYTIGLSKTHGESFAASGQINLEQAIDYERDFTFHDLRVEGNVLMKGQKAPIGNAELIFIKTDEEGESDFAGRTISKEDGSYALDGLSPGTYMVIASANGFRQTQIEIGKLDATFDREIKKEIRLEPGGTIEVTVLDAASNPVASAIVWITNEAGFIINQGLPPTTNPSGVYTFERLAPGTYTVTARLGEGAKSEPSTFTTDALKPVEITVQLPQ